MAFHADFIASFRRRNCVPCGHVRRRRCGPPSCTFLPTMNMKCGQFESVATAFPVFVWRMPYPGLPGLPDASMQHINRIEVPSHKQLMLFVVNKYWFYIWSSFFACETDELFRNSLARWRMSFRCTWIHRAVKPLRNVTKAARKMDIGAKIDFR